MSKSNTGGAGRGSFSGDLIGDVIFHGKKDYWKPGSNYFYHNLLKPGDSTLEVILMTRILPILTAAQKQKQQAQQSSGTDTKEPEDGKEQAAPSKQERLPVEEISIEDVKHELVDDYIEFMQTPDSHNDTYCGTSHRMFFDNLVNKKKDKFLCPDNDQHNVDAACALVTTIPVALFTADEKRTVDNIHKFVKLFRNSEKAPTYAELLGVVLRLVAIENANPKEVTKSVALNTFKYNLVEMKASNPIRSKGFSVKAVLKDPDSVTACYLQQTFPAVLQMVYKYTFEDKTMSFRAAVLANANRGGENVNTGAVLGAIMGAYCGFSNLPTDLVEGLAAQAPQARKQELEQAIEEFLDVCPLLNKL